MKVKVSSEPYQQAHLVKKFDKHPADEAVDEVFVQDPKTKKNLARIEIYAHLGFLGFKDQLTKLLESLEFEVKGG